MSLVKSFLFSALLLFVFDSVVVAQNIEIVVSGVKSGKGQALIAVFKDQESYEKREPFIGLQFDKSKIVDGQMTTSIELEPGVYGISFLDDKNKNGEMDNNWIGIPKEGFGFSNFEHKGFKKPRFDDFQIEIMEGETRSIVIKMKYM
jgi:uncharacterized protein (DUF2141 family)